MAASSSTDDLETVVQESVQRLEDVCVVKQRFVWICRLHQQAFDSLYSSFCLPVCLWTVRTGCCVLHVIASHELSKYSRSNPTSVVCDHLSGIPYLEI